MKPVQSCSNRRDKCVGSGSMLCRWMHSTATKMGKKEHEVDSHVRAALHCTLLQAVLLPFSFPLFRYLIVFYLFIRAV